MQARQRQWVGRLGILMLSLLPGMAAARPQPIAPTPEAVSGPRPGVATLEAALYRVPAFAEPLVPTGPTTLKEDAALLHAVTVYAHGPRATAFAPLTQFLKTHPDSPWAAALTTNMGLTWYHHGYFDRAIQSFQTAWTLSRSATRPQARALADEAVGELLQMHARLGHKRRIAQLLTEVKGRPLTGPATEYVQGAREGLWHMRHDWGVAYLCGPMAVKNVLLALHPHDAQDLQTILAFRSGPHGVTLNQVQALARAAHLPYVMARRIGDAPIPLPAVVHWKVHHYAALIGYAHGRYHVQDPTFGGDLWITQRALNAESDGYFLIPIPVAPHAAPTPGLVPVALHPDSWGGPPGFLPVSEAQAHRVYGRGLTATQNGNTGGHDTKALCRCQKQATKPPRKAGSGPGPGMPTANAIAMTVSLTLTDTPLFYMPPKGPAVRFTVRYSQREATQPANIPYGNLGPKWSFRYVGYIEDDPANPYGNIERVLGSGGAMTERGFNGIRYVPEPLTGDVLTQTGPASYTLTRPDGSQLVYTQSDGASFYPRRIFLTALVDAHGNAVTLHYDAQMRLVSVTDALNQTSTLTYGNASNPLLITAFTDPFGRQARFTYDAQGRLTSITDAQGQTSTFTYDAGGFITALTTPYGTSRFAYGENGTERWLTLTDPLGGTSKVDYRDYAPGIAMSAAHAPTGLPLDNDLLVYRNTFVWDPAAYAQYPTDYTKARLLHWLHQQGNVNVTSRVLESVKDPLTHRVWYGYPGQYPYGNGPVFAGTLDFPNNVARVLGDGRNDLDQLGRNALGRLIRRIDPAGRITDYTYAPNQIDLLEIQQQNAQGGLDPIAQYTDNTQHEPLSYTDAAGQTTTYTYNAAGQLTSRTDPLGHTTTYVYSSAGYLTSIVDANGKTEAAFTYDPIGRVASATDAGGETLTFTYDNLNRLMSVGYPDGTHTTYTYNKLDLASVTDRLGRTTTYTHDANRNLIAVTDPLGQTTRYTYDADNRRISQTDANGNTITWTRDLEGRVIATTDALGAITRYAYGPGAGRLATTTDALNQTTQYGYTVDGKLASLTYVNAQALTPNVALSYDPAYPRLTQMQDGTGTTAFAYGSAGNLGALQLTQVQVPTPKAVIQYAYDAVGRRTTQSIDGITETVAYDALNRPIQDQNALGTFTTSYLGETNQPTQVAQSGGPFAVLYQYETNTGDRRLKAILNELNGSPTSLQSFQYTTDDADRIDTITGSRLRIPHRHEHDGHAARTDRDEQGDDRLQALERRLEALPAHLARAFTDPEDRDHHSGGASTQTFTYDADDQLTGLQARHQNTTYSYDPVANLLTVQGPVSFSGTYNGANELTQANTSTLTYDLDGQLTSDGTHTFTRDAAHRLNAVTNITTGAITQSFYNGLNQRVSITTQANGTATPVTTNYLWCGTTLCQARSATDQITGQYFSEGEIQNGTPYLYARNHLGSVVNLITPQGTVVDTVSYSPYGRIVSNTGTVTPTFGYAGMFQDPSTGLSLTLYRAYDPNLRRWLSRDPIGETGSGVNLYGYVGGDPVNERDPAGLVPDVLELSCIDPAQPLCWIGVVVDFATDATIIGGAGAVLNSDSQQADKPPPGSLPIDQTPWSGDHGDIKHGAGAGGADNVKISPDGDVWVENPDGTWTNAGAASNYTGSGKPRGRRGKDRFRGKGAGC